MRCTARKRIAVKGKYRYLEKDIANPMLVGTEYDTRDDETIELALKSSVMDRNLYEYG